MHFLNQIISLSSYKSSSTNYSRRWLPSAYPHDQSGAHPWCNDSLPIGEKNQRETSNVHKSSNNRAWKPTTTKVKFPFHTPWKYIVYWAERRLWAGGPFVGCSSWEFRFRTDPNECHVQSGGPSVSFFASFHLLPPTGFRIIGSQIMNGRTVSSWKKLHVKTNCELQGNFDGWGVRLPCCSAATFLTISRCLLMYQ
jgi:hypothetical protein